MSLADTTDPAPPPFSPLAFLVDPGSQCPRLVARPTFAWPMSILLAGTVGLSASYYAHVDYRWLQETLLASHPGLAAFARGAPMPVDKFTVIGPAIASAALGSVFEWLAVALYVVFLGALVKRARPFKLALAIAAWVRVPFIVAMIPSSINVAIHPDGRLLPGQIDPATFAGLVGMPHDPFWQSLAQGVSLDYLWACALLVICLRHALAMSRWKALASVVAPATFIKLIAALAMTSALAS